MRSSILFNALVSATCTITLTSAQTFSQCNPLKGGSCPPNTALGRSVSVDLTSGASDSFTPQDNPTYDSNGASLTVAKNGEAPQLNSKWYIMFGHVEFVIKAAPGTGIVSSAVLQSDTLDEIDWEWLGGDNSQVQSNYFGKGQTLNYNRGAFHAAPSNQDGFKTYTIDWTADQIVWSIDGKTVRVVSSSTSTQYPYPQTPMMVKVGAWCGGCPSNAPGTIEWAGGPPDFASGGSSMQVKSISVKDYSTGSQYQYTGTDGTWQSITAVGGSVNSTGGRGSSAAAAAPEVSASTNSGPMPFQGTQGDSSTNVAQPGETPTVTTYPGLPEGWTVTSSGKVLPPSAAPATSPPISPSSSPEVSQQDSPAGGYESVTRYDGQGFPVAVTQANAGATAVQHYDDKGFLITTGPVLASRASPTPDAEGQVSPDVQALGASASSGTQAISRTTAAPTNAGSVSGLSKTVIGTLFCSLWFLFAL